ncbi:MAG: hypothetical protein JXA21_00810 [Anaerolineae bacterium]|nr:hypothetical protein [Anaerolineae bacterium]
MLWWLVLLGMIACVVVPGPALTPTPQAATASRTQAPDVSPTPSSTPTLTPTPAPTTTPTPLPGPGLDVAKIHVFPQPLAAGDYVSLDVDPRLPDDPGILENAPLTLTVQWPDGSESLAPFEILGLDEQYQAHVYWGWEAPDLAGTLPLTFTLTVPDSVPDPNPADNVVSLALPLVAPESLAPPEPETHWAMTDVKGIHLHYLTGSAAERDLAELVVMAQTAYAGVTQYLDTEGDTLDVYLADRVIGQGGYASSNWVLVTYTDRMYAPVSLDMVLRHEFTHRLDRAIGCETAPAMLREGLAVYLAGGHYRAEPVRRKAATIVEVAQYVTLDDLTGNFYQLQHEVSYAEAGSLVMYLLEKYGWESLETVCRAAAQTEGDDRTRLAAGVQALGAGKLGDLETDWLAWLAKEEVTPTDVALLEVDLRLMEAMRAYQERYNLSAHFLEGILFDPQEAERMGIVADFVRRPREPEPIAIELLLALAQDAIRREAALQAASTLDAIVQVLADGNFARGLPADTLAITRAALAQNYEPYQLLPKGQGYELYTLDRNAWPERHRFEATREEGSWKITEGP